MWSVVLLCLGASVGSGATPALPETKPKVSIAESQVSNWVRVWQKRLRLEDWKIETRIVRASELKPDTLGNLKWNSVLRSATIKVLNPLDYEIPASEISEDIEYTVVHELIHLQLSVLPRDLNRKDVEEQVVNKMCDALMQLEKGDQFRARSLPVAPYAAAETGEAASRQSAGRQIRRPDPSPK